MIVFANVVAWFALAFAVAGLAAVIWLIRQSTRFHRAVASHPLAIARCTVEQCTTIATINQPGGTWTRAQYDRHYCPKHPADTSCRICGEDKGTNAIICADCARRELL